MKRKMTVAICASLLTLSLVGCSSTEEKPKDTGAGTSTETSAETSGLQDGTYEVETAEADDHGGKARVKVVVADGKITEATYNEFNADGDKRDSEEYNAMMEEQAGTSPAKYEVEIEKQIMETQSAEIDGVTGATSSSDKAKQLFAAALENAKEGNTEKELFSVGQALELQDGTYEAETKEADDHGGKARVKVVVADGKITEATYNEFNADGDKRDSEEYNAMMEEQAGTSPAKYEVEIEKQVMESQSAKIDGVTGATSSSDKAKGLFEAALKNAAEGKVEKALI